jgi:hypothetical protein
MKRSIMSPINRLACLLAFIFGACIAQAQDDSMSSTNKSTLSETLSAYQPFNLGVEAGTTGIGGSAGWRFANHLGLVGGGDYFSYTLNKTISGTPYSAKLRLQTENVGLHLYPSKSSSFYIGLGAYFNQNQLNGSAYSTAANPIMVDGYTVPPNESVSLTYKQQPVDPYVSIGGNIYFDQAHHFSLGAELGAFYLGNPKVNISDNVPQPYKANYEQEATHDLKKTPVWPVLKISFNYSF